MKNSLRFLSAWFIAFISLFICSNNAFGQAPSNDDCATAQLLAITLDSTCYDGSNIGATASAAADPQGADHGYNGGDVWYKFVAPESGRVIIHTNAGTLDEGGMALYSGNCGPTLTQIALSTEGLGTDNYMPRIDTDDYNLSLTEGTTYYVRFWGYEGIEGTFSICIWTIPVTAGDECADATPLNVQFDCNYRQFHNLYATHSVGIPAPGCGSYVGNSTSTGDVWFSFVAPPNGHVIIKSAIGNTNPTLTDCAMALYRGTCSNLTRMTCSDDAPGIPIDPMPLIDQENLTPGQTYYIRFWDKSCNERGYFNICVYTTRPENDECNTAIPLDAPMASNCTYQTQTNYGATNNAALPAPPCGNYQGGDVWYTVEAEAGKRIVVTTQFGDVTNAGLALYSGEDCNNLTLLSCVADGGMPEIAMQGFAENQTLYVRFWSVGNLQQGTYGICAYKTEEQSVVLGTDRYVWSECNDNSPLIVCDNGGANGNYGINRDDTLTIYSSDPNETAIEITFIDFNVSETDTLFIYNGSTADPSLLVFQLGPQLQSWLNNSNSPDYGPSGMLSVVSTLPGDMTGALTIRFKTGSESNGEAPGFRFKISCSVPCQPVIVNTELMNTLIQPTPTLEEDGYYYIDLCPTTSTNDNSTVTFFGACQYNANDFSYHQADDSTMFIWRMEDTTFQGYGMTQQTYTFTEGRGSTVSLNTIDQRGCRSSNVAVYRVRVSANPILSISIPGICAGEVHEIGVGSSSMSAIVIGAVGSGEATSLTVSETIFLPDGIPCEPMGCSYQSPVTFTAFAPNAHIRTVEDIYYLRINMEHSYAGDIWINLTCPNGQRADIMKYGGSGTAQCASYIPSSARTWSNAFSNASTGTYFGDALDTNDGDVCNPNAPGNAPGIGWNYCWSNNTTQGYTYSNSGDGRIYRSGNAHNNKFDSTNVAEMTQVYHPDESFENLIGCPMNGSWYIEILDGWSSDNGYLFEWELALSPDLLPADWQYNVELDAVEIEGPWAAPVNDSTMGITPPIPEVAHDTIVNYTFTIIDEYGCRYDTIVPIEIFPGYGGTTYDEICEGIPYDKYGFFIANPTAGFGGTDTTLYYSQYDLQTVTHGCDSSISLELTIHPNKETFFNASICEGEQYNANGFNVSGFAEGEWIYRNVHTTAHGCDTVATLYLTVYPMPDPEIIGVSTICLGASTTLSVTGGDNNSSYIWNTGATTPSITVTPTVNTTYSVTVSNGTGCEASTEITVLVSEHYVPEVQIEGIMDIHCGASTQLTAIVDGDDEIAFYQWFENGNLINNADGPTVTVSPTNNSVYSVIITTTFGCTRMTAATVNVESNTVTIEGAQPIQCGESIILSAHVDNDVTFVYEWRLNGEIIEGITGAYLSASPNTTSVYSVKATSANGCTCTTETTLEVIPNIVEIEASTLVVAYSDSVVLTAINVTGVPSTYTWTWDGGSATGEQVVVYPEAPTTYHLTATTNEGNCTANAEITIEVAYFFAPPSSVNPDYFLVGGVDSTCRAIVHWTPPTPSLMAQGGTFIGYNIFRDGEKLNDTPIPQDSLIDIQLPEGTYVYCVSCVYVGGESDRTCGSIDFNAEYNAPTTILTSRTEDCSVTLFWNTPDKNCWANLEHYYIYRNGELIDSVKANQVFDTIYTDDLVGENRHQYCVKAQYIDSKGRPHLSDSLCEMVNTCYHVAVNVYPNPAKEQITIIANQMERVMLYDANGRFLRQINIPDKFCRTLVVSTKELPDGAYIFNIFMNDGNSAVKRFIVRH